MASEKQTVKGTQTEPVSPDLMLAVKNAQLALMRERQYQLKDGNLILNASEFDDSTTISDSPVNAAGSLFSVKNKKTVERAHNANKVGVSTTVDLEMSPPVQRRLFTEVSCFLSKMPILNFMPSLSIWDIDPNIEVPRFFANPIDIVHLLCLLPP